MGSVSAGCAGCTTLHPMSRKGEAQLNDTAGDFGEVTLGVGISHLGLVLWEPLGVLGISLNVIQP